MDRKKILFVIDSLGCGGAEKSLVSLLPLLSKEKYEIHLWILKRGGEFESMLPLDVILEDEPTYGFVERIKIITAHLWFSFYYRLLRTIRIKKHGAETLWKCCGWATKSLNGDFDVAIAYQQGEPTYLVAHKIRAKKKIAWVNADIFQAGYDKKFNSIYYELYDLIVLVSKALTTIMERRLPQFKNKYITIYDILNPNLIQKLSHEHIDDIMNDENIVKLLTVGRLAPPKNYILAVKTAQELRKRSVRFVWYFIGEGGEFENIRMEIEKYSLQDRVILLGLKTNPYKYMKLCDIYVQTSKFEGFGLTISEAKILNKPIVCTNFEVAKDQIIDGENGLIAEMNEVAISDKIEKIIKDRNLRNKLISALEGENNMTYLTEVKKVEELLDR
jgi:glycosyltransferase involved in cell wall biosynthesis